MPSAAVRPPTSTASSNVIGMNIGQLFSGRPPTFSGYHTPIAYHCMKKPPAAPRSAPVRTSSGSHVGRKPSASVSPSTGNGTQASMRR